MVSMLQRFKRAGSLRSIGGLLGIVFLALVLITTAVPGCAPKPPAVETLTLVSAWSAPHAGNVWLDHFVERINTEAKTVRIDYKGGPEVIPPLEALGYVSKGAVDLLFSTPPYYAGKIPAALSALNFVASPAEERESGFWDLFDKMHREKAGVTALGQLWRGEPFGTFLKDPIDKADFTGLKLRTVPLFDPLAHALGATTTTMATGEVYTALERGVVDGFMYPYGPGFIELKWYEVVDYAIHPVIPYESSAPLLAYLPRWDALPDEVKREITDLILELEPELYEWYKSESVKSVDWAVQQGHIKIIELPEPEAKKYVRMAREELWKFILEKDPEYGPKLKAIAEKIDKVKLG